MKYPVLLLSLSILLLSLTLNAQKTSKEYWDALGVATKHYNDANYEAAAKAYEILWTKSNGREIANHRLHAAAANCMIDNERAVRENLMKIVAVANKTDVKRVLINYQIFDKYKNTTWWETLEQQLNARVEQLIAHHKNLKIFKKGRNYTYQALRINVAGDAIANKRIFLIPRGTGWGDEAADLQSEIVFKYEKGLQDSVTHFAEVDSMVTSKFWNYLDTTGVVENSERVEIHPIRNNEFYKTELAPFPEVRFPIGDPENDTMISTIHVLSNWGLFTGSQTKVRKIYQGTEKRNYKNIGEIKCHKYKGVGNNSRYGESMLVYYFHKDYGFTEMNYLTYDKEKILFKLIGIETDDSSL